MTMIGRQYKVGLFGLTANPVHMGHWSVVDRAAAGLDEVWINPVFIHPWGKDMVSYEHRKKMCELIFNNIPNARIVELDKEYYEKNQKVPYSYDVLSYAKETLGVSCHLIIGEDNEKPEVWNKFYKAKEIVEEFKLFVVKDSGTHSTQIREMIKKQQWEMVTNFCGKDVVEYIIKNKLYLE